MRKKVRNVIVLEFGMNALACADQNPMRFGELKLSCCTLISMYMQSLVALWGTLVSYGRRSALIERASQTSEHILGSSLCS